jgi:hypothetical protein
MSYRNYDRNYEDKSKFSDLVGKTLVSVTGATNGSDEVIFTDDQGAVFALRHYQDCCEHVDVEDVAGDVADLIGSPIVRAEENSNEDVQAHDDGGDKTESYEAQEWTFYRIATAKGTVVIRFYGASDYYSTRVNFVCDVQPKEAVKIGA